MLHWRVRVRRPPEHVLEQPPQVCHAPQLPLIGHACSLHRRLWLASRPLPSMPVQSMPPKSGLGFVQLRVRVWNPLMPPAGVQLCEHVGQRPQPDQPPLMGHGCGLQLRS